MKAWRRFAGLAPLVAIALLALSAAPAAAQRSLEIRRFDATLTVNRDGSVDVTEKITARFNGAWNGIYRTVPVQYHTPQGFRWTLRLDHFSATDSAGQPLETESSRERHYIKYKIWVPGAQDATHTVVLKYRALNGLRFFEDHDELYWNVTGDEWDVPIEAASARIVLPEGAVNVRALAFNGAYGATARDAVVSTGRNTVQLRMPHQLDFHEGLTAVVGWNKGLVTEPTPTDQATSFFATNWPLMIPLPVLLGMFTVWYRRGRDPRRLPVTVQYEPGDGLTPAEAGTLVDYSADMRDITATLVDLAVRGYLRIEEKEERRLLGLLKRREFVFHRLKPRTEWAGLAPHEQKLLTGLFESDAPSVELSDLENEFYRHIAGIEKAVMARLVEKKLYRGNPESVKGLWAFLGILAGALIVVLGSAIGNRLGFTPLPFFVSGVVTGSIVLLFGRIMPARTAAGARALERILGFEEFLRRVEGDRLERVVRTPEMFERFLPFAMAFGVEKRWAKAFKDLQMQPPTWYYGVNATDFNARYLSDRLGVLSERAGSALTSSPRSSGGSGFSGGSSGGGSGGGGGGGF